MTSAQPDTLTREYETLTRACGLVDRGERGKLVLTGRDAAKFLNGQVSNDIVSLGAGQGCYAAFLTHKGKMLGDLRVLAVAPQEPLSWPGAAEVALLLDTERVALQSLFDMIRRFKVGHAVELHKATLERGLLSLVGPEARAVAQAAAGHGPPPEEHAHRAATIAGAAVLLISTDVGLDVLCETPDLSPVRAALVAHGASEVSEPAAEIVRVARGRPRYGIDLDDTTIPQEAGLNERAVSFTKGCYVGQETVARLYYRGSPTRHLRGLLLSAPASGGEQLHLGERPVGRLASTVISPDLGPIALALVRREAQPGDELGVGDGDVLARVASLPFAS